MKNIYLDNAATTPIDERVFESMVPYFKESFGNASSIHKYGREAKVLLEDARDTVADYIGARPSEIYFTSGGTEANNFAIKGIAFNNLGGKKEIISSRIEHSAILDTLEYLKLRFGFNIKYVNNNRHGIIDIDNLKDSITKDTGLICIMHSNNELGVINDISSIAELANTKCIKLHSDTVQSLGKTELNIGKIGCDTASFSAHKIYGPKGIGALYIKRGTTIDKFIHGGKQERDRRGGTENIAAIAGFKKAIEILKSEMNNDLSHYEKLRNKLIRILNEKFRDKIIINTADNALNNIVNISFAPNNIKVDSDTLLIKLDMKGIAVSSGSACASGSIQPSHVLKALGYDENTSRSSLRVSFGRFNVESDVDYFIETLNNILGS